MPGIKKISSAGIFVILAILIPLTAFIIENWWEDHYSSVPVYESLFQAPERKADSYHFQNQRGENITPAIWADKIAVVDFFFTSCPTICPKMTSSLQKVQLQFGNAVQIISFTVDPEHDNPEKLQKYAMRYTGSRSNWQFITGNKKDIYQMARNDFRLTTIDGDGGEADFIHSNKLVLVDRQQRIRGYYDGTSEAEVKNMLQDIRKLLNE